MKSKHYENLAIALAYYVDGLTHKQINRKFGKQKYLTEKLNSLLCSNYIGNVVIDRIKERERKRKENERGFGFADGVFLGHKREAYHTNENDYEGEELFTHQLLIKQ